MKNSVKRNAAFSATPARRLPTQWAEAAMRMSALAFAGLGVCAMVACQQKGEMGPPGPMGPQGRAGAAGAPGSIAAPVADGTSSGGGGYAQNNAEPILREAKTELASMIRRATPQIFANLPSGWNQERLARVVEETRERPLSVFGLSRNGRLLMFDYGSDERGPYVVALRPFFELYASQPIRFMTTAARSQLIMDVQSKLLHEVVHHWFEPKNDEDDQRALRIGERYLRAMHRDVVSCVAPSFERDLSPGDRRREWTPEPIYFLQALALASNSADCVRGWICSPGFSEWDYAKALSDERFSIAKMGDSAIERLMSLTRSDGPQRDRIVMVETAAPVAQRPAYRYELTQTALNRYDLRVSVASPAPVPPSGPIQDVPGQVRTYSCVGFAPVVTLE